MFHMSANLTFGGGEKIIGIKALGPLKAYKGRKKNVATFLETVKKIILPLSVHYLSVHYLFLSLCHIYLQKTIMVF